MSHMNRWQVAYWGLPKGGSLCSAHAPFRGQAAVEMLSYAAFFLLIFLASVVIFFQMQSLELSRAENAYAQQVAYGFVENIYTAFVAGPGFTSNVTIPQYILNKPYMIKVTSAGAPGKEETGFVYVEWEDKSFSAPAIAVKYSAPQTGCINTTSGVGGGIVVIINASAGCPIIIENKGNNVIRFEPG